MHDRTERHRSLINVALKVISYATIVIPLIALLVKVALRSYLQISSIQFNTSFASQSRIETRVTPAVTKHCISFLSYKDQGQFAQVALFARDNVRGLQKRYIDWTAPFKEKISNLPLSSPDIEVFRPIILALITSPAVGHPHYWHPLMDDVLERFLPQEMIVGNMDTLIEGHTQIARALAASETPISSGQLYHFCKYLQSNQLTKFQAWAWLGYIVLEQYGLNSASVKRVLQDYLKRHAENYMNASSTSNDTIKYRTVDVDPRYWFGVSGVEHSLLKSKTEGEEPSIPEPLLEVLWTRIQFLRAAHSDLPFQVGMEGRSEAHLPTNYTLVLAQRITNAEMFLDSNDTVKHCLKSLRMQSQ